MIPTISQICSLHSSLEKDVEDYAAAECRSIEVWFGKLEAFLQHHSANDFRRLLEQHEMRAPVASYQGGLLQTQGEKRKQAWELFETRLELCNAVGIGSLVVACDVMAPVTHEDVQRMHTSLTLVAQLAERQGRRVAIEFQANAAFGNNLQTMAALVDVVGSPQLGICLDAFHFYNGPSKLADLELLTKENLFHVQLSDVADVPREFATDSHRILPGEGDVPTATILARLAEIEYGGCVSLETMNPQIWQVPALQFGEIAMKSLRSQLPRMEG